MNFEHNQLQISRVVAVLLIVLSATTNAEFLLVDIEADVLPAPVVLFADAPPKTRQAAVELVDYIEKIAGERPNLIEGRPDSLPERAIWVGYQPMLENIFPAVEFSLSHPEEILITANDAHIVIIGRDRWDPAHLTIEGIDEKIVGVQQEYGTVNAIYTFLKEYLGVRWLWPGELGEDVQQSKRVAMQPFEYRYHPQIRARSGTFAFSRLSNKGYGRAQNWTRRQRLQLDSLRAEGGHAFGDWHQRFAASKPELFALQPDGSRGTFPSPRNVKLCQSNPAVWEQWLADVEAVLEKDPTRKVFNASPNDGWYSGHCVCESCRAWDHPDGEPRKMLWKNHRETRPALSDRHVTFANRLAALLKERFPDQDYRVSMLSYGHSRPPPVEARPADNVVVVSVANFFGRSELVDRGSSSGSLHRDQLAEWGKLSQNLIWRPNAGSPAGGQQGLPDLSISQTMRDLKFAANNQTIGIYIDAIWEHWATQGPQYYVLAQLVWDPAGDVSTILDDYYTRAFGPAAAAVRSYFEIVETRRMEYVAEFGYGAGAMNLPKLYTTEMLHRAETHLQEAALAVKSAPAIYKQRVEFVRAGLTYTQMLTEIIVWMKDYWQNEDRAIAERVREQWKSIKDLCAAHPYAINCGPVRPKTGRMRGLHPDYPDPKRKKNRAGFDRD